MRRVFLLITTIILLLAMAVSASAITAATSVSVNATVSPSESCDVVLTASVHLDEPVSGLTFPIPADATNITLNGSRIGASQTEEARHVNLSRVIGEMAGDFTFIITYRLKDVVAYNDIDILELQLPLLAGFAYPVQELDFSVTMPGDISAKPAFSSGYHHANIEQDLTSSVKSNTITGSSRKDLKDRETLSMTLTVTEEMFPQKRIQLEDYDILYILMGVCAGLALLYWIFFLRCAPPRRVYVTAPPEGFTAGQLGTILSMQGANLTYMVLSWAQLGYLTIHIGRKERILLVKRMEMGNERSNFEQRCFNSLFARRTQVDTAGTHYAYQFRKVEILSPAGFGLINPKSGSPYLFRGLAALIGLFGGAILGMVLGMESSVQWFFIVIMALFGVLSSWFIHPWADDLSLHGKKRLLLALLLCLCWVGLSLLAEMLNMGLWIIFGQLLVGLMTAFGRRRTEAGKQAMAETLGLRRYLSSIPRVQLQYISKLNPDYFHTMAPYALALGVDRAFAKRFRKDIVPHCPYLITGTDERLTAAQWRKRLRRIVRSMDARRRQIPMERMIEIVSGFRKK